MLLRLRVSSFLSFEELPGCVRDVEAASARVSILSSVEASLV